MALKADSEEKDIRTCNKIKDVVDNQDNICRSMKEVIDNEHWTKKHNVNIDLKLDDLRTTFKHIVKQKKNQD